MTAPNEPHADSSSASAIVLSVVHPDYLPSMYALAGVLKDAGVAVDVFCCESHAPPSPLWQSLNLHLCGRASGRIWERWATRRRLVAAAGARVREREAQAILATCPFTYLAALRIAAGVRPVVYLAYETYEVRFAEALRAPLSWWRSRSAFRRLREAALVCVPSPERAGWLLARARLERLPSVVLNCPSRQSMPLASDTDAFTILPARFRGRPLVIHTGRASHAQAVRELVDSVAMWPRDACLVVTNIDDSQYGLEVKRSVERSPRRDDIVVLPAISRSHLLALQGAASVGVFLLRETSALETVMPAPNKVGEYLHAGLVIVGARTAYLEMLEREGVAVISESLEPTAIARSIEGALGHVRNGDSRTRARSIAGAWYNMETQARPILRVITDVWDVRANARKPGRSVRVPRSPAEPAPADANGHRRVSPRA